MASTASQQGWSAEGHSSVALEDPIGPSALLLCSSHPLPNSNPWQLAVTATYTCVVTVVSGMLLLAPVAVCLTQRSQHTYLLLAGVAGCVQLLRSHVCQSQPPLARAPALTPLSACPQTIKRRVRGWGSTTACHMAAAAPATWQQQQQPAAPAQAVRAPAAPRQQRAPATWLLCRPMRASGGSTW